MPYADSDFFLALLKDDDWLRKRSMNLSEKYKGSIWTSEYAIIEILLICKKFNLDPENVVASILQIADVDNKDSLLAVAHLMKKYKMSVFDALHAVASGNDEIISSDKIYDKIGLRRIRLEK